MKVECYTSSALRTNFGWCLLLRYSCRFLPHSSMGAPCKSCERCFACSRWCYLSRHFHLDFSLPHWSWCRYLVEETFRKISHFHESDQLWNILSTNWFEEAWSCSGTTPLLQCSSWSFAKQTWGLAWYPSTKSLTDNSLTVAGLREYSQLLSNCLRGSSKKIGYYSGAFSRGLQLSNCLAEVTNFQIGGCMSSRSVPAVRRGFTLWKLADLESLVIIFGVFVNFIL